jgi:antitoxin component of MazEF toxin-antitoxin module
MPDKNYKNQNIRKLTKIGKASLGLTLPKDIIAKLKLRERQRVVVKLKGRKIIITDWKKKHVKK